MSDRFTRRIHCLRISVTDRCQLRCGYCMPPDGISLRPPGDILRYEEITELVSLLHRLAPIERLRITGGEPLVRPDIERLIAMLAELHVPDMALTTNGQLLSKFSGALKGAGLGRVNVSLDSLNEKTYREISCGGILGQTLEGIEKALGCGLSPVKLNMVVMRGVNDSEILDMVKFALERGVEVRFLEVMPIGAVAKHSRQWFFPGEEVRAVIQTRYALEPLPREPGSTSRSFIVGEGGASVGKVGFISACSTPFCHDCGRLRLTSDGRLIGCLATDGGVPLRALLSSGAAGERQLEESLETILVSKRVREAFNQPQPMAAIGG